MVFQTAPPQPASNARITCSPQLVGGADASQNGFGDTIPAKLTLRSGMRWLQLLSHRDSGALPIGNCVHYLPPTIYAIAAGEVFRIRSPACPAFNRHATIFQ